MPSLSPDICPPELTVSGKSPASGSVCIGGQHSLGSSVLRMLKLILISIYTTLVESNGAIMTFIPLGERESVYSTGNNYVHVGLSIIAKFFTKVFGGLEIGNSTFSMLSV